MSILAECPVCHRKQGAKNKLCTCGTDMDKMKRGKKVRYWIKFRMPGGKQKKESVGFSIEEARDADGKRRGQKRENRIFDIKPEVKMTFNELTKWYLDLEKVKALSSYWRIQISLDKFNSVFGNYIVSQIKPADLENHQAKRAAEGLAPATIDQEIGAAKTMVFKAFDNDIVGGETLKTFKRVKRLLKANSNARDMILTPEQFKGLMTHLPFHAKQIFATAYYTGMRLGEILPLTWDKVDLKNRMIRLEATDTKDREARNIPIMEPLYELLNAIPRPIHHSYVFTFRDKPIMDVRTAVKRACRDAGIPYGRFVKDGFVFHDLRHTFNTYMRKAGVPESVIMDITGHSTRVMFDRYNTVDKEDKKLAVTQLETFLANGPQNGPQVGNQEG